MIKLLSPEPNGGMPFEIEDLLRIQDGLYLGLSFLCNAAAIPFILSGCEVTASTSSTCTVTAGWVWLEGDFRYFPGYTGNYPFYIVKDVNQFTTKTFENGSVQNALVDAFAKPVATVATGQENIAMNPGSDVRYKKALTGDLQAAIDKINKELPTKATKLFNRVPWTDLVLTDDAYSVTSPGVRRAQYMMDEFGTVHLRGSITNNKLIAGQNLSALTLAVLPPSIVPNHHMNLVAASVFGAPSNGGSQLRYNQLRMVILGKDTGGADIGKLTVSTSEVFSDSVSVSLDGISWNMSA
jgi:hypothetical protein